MGGKNLLKKHGPDRGGHSDGWVKVSYKKGGIGILEQGKRGRRTPLGTVLKGGGKGKKSDLLSRGRRLPAVEKKKRDTGEWTHSGGGNMLPWGMRKKGGVVVWGGARHVWERPRTEKEKKNFRSGKREKGRELGYRVYRGHVPLFSVGGRG